MCIAHAFHSLWHLSIWCLEMAIQRCLLCHTPWIFFFPWMLRLLVVVLLLNCVWPFCNPLGCSPPDFFPWNFPGKNIRGLPFPSPGDLPTQRLNPCLLLWQVDSLPLSHQGSPQNQGPFLVSTKVMPHKKSSFSWRYRGLNPGPRACEAWNLCCW